MHYKIQIRNEDGLYTDNVSDNIQYSVSRWSYLKGCHFYCALLQMTLEIATECCVSWQSGEKC